ncbi:MAG: hypothetical protein WCZ87_09710 [Thiohalobacteraceae bacterium]
MAGDERFYRDVPIEVRPARLPAELYNLTRRLLARGGADCLFVPIRSIQYMAVIDAEEVIFVDREVKRLIELAWRSFRPQARAALTDPVPYEQHLYLDKARATLVNLQGEFLKALIVMDQRTGAALRSGAGSQVLPFPGGRNK